jgi:hypothetical protein
LKFLRLIGFFAKDPRVWVEAIGGLIYWHFLVLFLHQKDLKYLIFAIIVCFTAVFISAMMKPRVHMVRIVSDTPLTDEDIAAVDADYYRIFGMEPSYIETSVETDNK